MSAAASASGIGPAKALPPRLRRPSLGAAAPRLGAGGAPPHDAAARRRGGRACSCSATGGDNESNNNPNQNNNPDHRLPSLDEDDLPPRPSPSQQQPPSPPPEPLAAELARYAAPQRREAMRRAAERLDLAWSIARSPRGSQGRSACGCCSGSGRTECRWCRGTGAMMLGGSVLERGGSGSEGGEGEGAAASGGGEDAASTPPPTCMVCKGRGHVACEDCRGTGYRASWMGPSECKTRR